MEYIAGKRRPSTQARRWGSEEGEDPSAIPIVSSERNQVVEVDLQQPKKFCSALFFIDCIQKIKHSFQFSKYKMEYEYIFIK